MDPQPVMWINDIRREVKIPPKIRKCGPISGHTKKEYLRGRTNLEAGEHSSRESSREETRNSEGSSSSKD
jgi:hypothetical protein